MPGEGYIWDLQGRHGPRSLEPESTWRRGGGQPGAGQGLPSLPQNLSSFLLFLHLPSWLPFPSFVPGRALCEKASCRPQGTPTWPHGVAGRARLLICELGAQRAYRGAAASPSSVPIRLHTREPVNTSFVVTPAHTLLARCQATHVCHGVPASRPSPSLANRKPNAGLHEGLKAGTPFPHPQPTSLPSPGGKQVCAVRDDRALP